MSNEVCFKIIACKIIQTEDSIIIILFQHKETAVESVPVRVSYRIFSLGGEMLCVG